MVRGRVWGRERRRSEDGRNRVARFIVVI